MKKKKVLIIRSVSFQQLDKNLPVILKSFNNSEFYILTHSHGIENCKKYRGIKEIIEYKSKKNFSPFKTNNLKKKFDTVIYLVSNIAGYGFFNVSLLAHKLNTKEVFQCNINSELKKTSKYTITKKILSALFFIPITSLITLPLIPIVFLILLIRNIKKSDFNKSFSTIK